MDPDVVPPHSSSSLPPPPPPLGDGGGGEMGSEDDEFGDFGGFSCSSPGSAESPPPSLKPATHPTTCSFNQTVEQSQPTSTVNLEGRECNAASSSRLTNGFAGRHRDSGSAVAACSPDEETGFADFTVFSDQAAHPWCCGFSPMSGAERWDGRAGGTNLSPGGRDVITEAEPRSHCAQEADENVEECENGDAEGAQTSQDHHQPQDAAAASRFPSAEEERRFGLNSPQTSEAEEAGNKDHSASSVLQRLGMYESVSEDVASFGDDLSFEGVSADLEPNVSSLDQTDWDRTDDEEEELELSDSFVDSRTGNLSRPGSERGFHHCDQHATQETRSTSNQSQPGVHTEDGSADGSSEHHRDQDVGVQILGNLPPSDSFADFCSAPTQEDGQSWAEFKDQNAQDQGKGWPRIREPVSRQQIDEDAEEDEDGEGQHGDSRRDSCQASLCCRVQQLLQTSFPEVLVPAVGGEEELLGLSDLLQNPPLSEEQEAAAELRGALWIQEMLSPHRDVHSAVGLRFQWGGSHSNRTLLSCLGVDTRNIVFIGTKKQPLTVPAFASGLGMLEPTKDSVVTVGSPGHSAVSPPDEPDPSTRSAQEELPSSHPDWSSRGLSSSQDGTSPRRAPHFWGRK